MSKKRESSTIPSSYTEKLLTRELADSERQIQKLIESYLLCEQRWQSMKEDSTTEGGKLPEKSSNHQTNQIQSSKEIEALRSLMRRLRRWRSGSQTLSYDSFKKLGTNLSAAKDKFLLFSLDRLNAHRAYFALDQSGDFGFHMEDNWSDLQARVCSCLQKKMSLHKEPNIESDLEKMWTQLVQLKSSVRVTSDREEKQLNTTMSRRRSDLSLARLNESDRDHQELINSLLKYVSKIKRIIDALKGGSHVLESLQDEDREKANISKVHKIGDKPKKTVRFKIDANETDRKNEFPTALTVDECADKDIEILLSYLSKFQRWLSGQEVYTKSSFDRMSRSLEVIETEHLIKGIDLSRGGSFCLSEILVMNQELDSEFDDVESELGCSSCDSETRSDRRSSSCHRLSASGRNADDNLTMKLVVRSKLAPNSPTRNYSDDVENLIEERLV